LSKNIKVAIKEIRKERLLTPNHHDFARNELAIHYSLSNYSNCTNIVKVMDYFEDKNSYYMAMEYSKEHGYFEELLENVCI
jgi:serine/threonine protein kinase